jgi:hypothetical protein
MLAEKKGANATDLTAPRERLGTLVILAST